MKSILAGLKEDEAFSRKGPKVVNKRWFSWLQGWEFHDKSWHSRLLVVLAIGLQLRVYRSYKDCPYWGGIHGMSQTPPAPEEEEEPADAKEKTGAKELEAVAKAEEKKAVAGAQEEGEARGASGEGPAS